MLRDKRILITGGSSGLGLGLAKALAADNALALVARDESKLAQAADAIRGATPGARVSVHAIDVSSVGAAAELQAVAGALGGLDVLINSAGILREGEFASLSEEDFRATMDINFHGSVRAIRALLPALSESRGRIVNVSSVAGFTGVYGYSAYCSSKFALIGLSESLAFELAPKGIPVQVVCPPEFDSPMVDALDEGRSPQNRAHAHSIPKLTLEQCVRDVVRGLDSDAFTIIPGNQTRVMTFLLRHLPGLSRRIGHLKVRAASR